MRFCGWRGLAAVVAMILLPVAGLERLSHWSLEALDPPPGAAFIARDGELLRVLPDTRGERHLAVPLQAVPVMVREAFIAAEDERFFSHRGVDCTALLRALKDSLLAGRVVSGASTITQQLARLAYPRTRRIVGKPAEMARAWRMERSLSKERILELYLNRVPMGNTVTGIGLAARLYFGKEVGSLSPSEAALLAALPKAPGLLNPFGPERGRLLQRRNWVLGRMRELGYIDVATWRAARLEGLHVGVRAFPLAAPHMTDLLIASGAGRRGETVHTTIDLGVQRRVERVLASHTGRLRQREVSQAAAVVVDNRDRSVVALAGSLRYGPRDGGWNNGAAALRSPGSALKPFLYALALDSGYTAATVLEDVVRAWRYPGGDYLPLNYDRHAYGPVSVRDALGNSLNLSAIQAANLVGYGPLYAVLTRLGLINHPEHGPDWYGLGLAVGNPEVSPLQMAAAYSALANGGIFRPLRLTAGGGEPLGERIFSAPAAAIVTDILADPSARAIGFAAAREMDFPWRVAIKTGTSTHYRDCWSAAYTPEYTVVVWGGNFSGFPTRRMSGASASTPILADIFNELYRGGTPGSFAMPPGVEKVAVCAYSGMRPGPGCAHLKEEWFISGTAMEKQCTFHTVASTRHELPSRYAGWLYGRWRRGGEGNWRLAGFEDDLGDLFAPSAPAAATLPGPDGRFHVGAADDGAVERTAGPAGTTSVSIVYPLAGDRYILDRRDGGSLALKAVCDGRIERLTWFVDGVEYAASGPPYQAEWPMVPGRHRIAAALPDGSGDAVDVTVE